MTKPRFYHRFEKTNNFFEDFQKSFTQAREVYLLNCFFDTWGFNKIVKAQVKRKKALNLKLLVDLGCSTPDALRKAYWLMKKKGSRFQVRYYGGNELFHSKLAFFKNVRSNIVFLGSSNLTKYGFFKHIETNIKLTGSLTEFERFCKDRWVKASELKQGDIKNSQEKNKPSEPVKTTKSRRRPKEIPPPWKPSDYRVPKNRKSRRKKRSSKKKVPPSKEVQELFLKKLLKKLPPSFKGSIRRGDWGYISERKGEDKNVLTYSFWFDQPSLVSVVIRLGTKPNSKAFVDYLNTKKQTKLKNLLNTLKKGKWVYLYDRTNHWPREGTSKEALSSSNPKVSTIVQKMKKINSTPNHTAILYVGYDVKYQDLTDTITIRNAKERMNELRPVYNFIKKGING